MADFDILIHPSQHEAHVYEQLELVGLQNTRENPNSAYCPISLSNVPEDIQHHIRNRQQTLVSNLESIGMSVYDPATAKFSPDTGRRANPTEVYTTDLKKIAEARFFVCNNLLASTGVGTELQLATNLNRMAVVLMDKAIGASRMLPPRIIYLQYRNLGEQMPQILELINMLREYTPGIGLIQRQSNKVPILLGEKEDGKVVDLESTIHEEFPDLRYNYEGKIPLLQLSTRNPELFYEHNA